jgi:hypothetical protein
MAQDIINSERSDRQTHNERGRGGRGRPRGGHQGYSEKTVYQFGTRGILNPAKAKLDMYDELNDDNSQTNKVEVY